MNSKEFMKTAAQSIRTLVKERDELQKTAEVGALATEIVETMVDKEMLAAEEILPKLAEFQARDINDLVVIKKALELGVDGNLSKFGELSDKIDGSGLSLEDKFVYNTIGDLL